ncbi:LCP family protein [Blastococcus sp. TF02A-26]|uniref:LCP family protein n=1 Tax=Blastococcus sp. TF02A-26 TaxID=2250577 RepID=UPI000DE877E3|nr:LCP family protein [Blastococcus sp. TF02A-26]RBY81898.1 LytR family transcriptional regulator [Blastococcus sp. TF02A-26]
MGDSRAGGGAGDGASGRDGEPLTLEQLILRQGAGPSGRRAARRTGEVPIPLLPGESLPAHRGPRPAVPPAAAGRPAADRAAASSAPRPAAPRADDTPPPARGLPPVPAATPQRPAAAAPPSSPPRPLPAAPPVAPGVRYSQPVPPLPGGGPGIQRSGPVPPLPGVRHSQPVPPLPGRPPADRRGRPLPPIPGLDAPGRSGATAAPRPPRKETRAARRAARSPGRRRLVRLAQAAAALIAVVVAYHLGLYVYVDNSIERVEALAVDGPELVAPQLQEGAATYLVVGTGLPGAEGVAGVAALLARVAPDEESAVLVSLPPTALVDTPSCRTSDGDVREPATEALGEALLDGGPACLVRAVQQLSGLRVDHYLGVDLARLPDMVDSLGGIPICLPSVTDAWAAAAEPLPAGASDLDGERAAGWLAPGDPAADVNGTAVAERAQVLLTSTLREAMSFDVLGNPVRLTSFLTTAADALTVDEATNLGDLRTLAATLGDLSGDSVQRTALPVTQVGYVPVGRDEAYVLLDRTATRILFETVLEEGELPAEALPAEAAPPAAPVEAAPPAEPPAAPAPTPSEVTVDVLNGTGTAGLAGTVADALRGVGFVVGEVGNERGGVDATVVRHGPAALAQAQTVLQAVPGAVLQADDSLGDRVQLVVGPNYASVVAPPPPAPPAPETSAAPSPSADVLAVEAAPASATVSCG